MSRLTGTVALLLALVIVLPAVAEAAQAAVPALFSLLVFLALVRLALPPGRRR